MVFLFDGVLDWSLVAGVVGVLDRILILKSFDEFCDGMSIWLLLVCCCCAPTGEVGELTLETIGNRPKLSMYLILSLFTVSLLVCSWLPTNKWGSICVGNESPVGLRAFGEWHVASGADETGAAAGVARPAKAATPAGLSCR